MCTLFVYHNVCCHTCLFGLAHINITQFNDTLSKCKKMKRKKLLNTGNIINRHAESAPHDICYDCLASLLRIIVVQDTVLTPLTACLNCGILLLV